MSRQLQVSNRTRYVHLICYQLRDDRGQYRNDFKTNCERVAGRIQQISNAPNSKPLIVAYHEPKDCGFGGDSDHVHFMYHHYRQSKITECIGHFIFELGLGYKLRNVWSPEGLRKYLRSGGGRLVLYEKEGDFPDFRGLHPYNNSAEPSTTGPSIPDESIRDKDSGEFEESDSEGAADIQEEVVGRGLEGNTSSSGRKKVKRAKIFTVQDLVRKYQPETSLELKALIYTHGTAYEQDFLTTSLASHLFSAQLDAMIEQDHLLMKQKPWEEMQVNLTSYAFRRPGHLDIGQSIQWILRILDFNDIDRHQFVTDVWEIIDRKVPKKNCLWLYGPPNSGKSLILNSIADSCIYAFRGDQPDAREARFAFTGMAPARVALLNEFKVYSNVADKMLLLLEGADVVTDVKGKAAINIPRTPMLISSNGELWDSLPNREIGTKRPAIIARTTRYNLQTMPELVDCPSAYFHPYAWNWLLEKYGLVTVETVITNDKFPYDELWNLKYDAEGNVITGCVTGIRESTEGIKPRSAVEPINEFIRTNWKKRKLESTSSNVLPQFSTLKPGPPASQFTHEEQSLLNFDESDLRCNEIIWFNDSD